MTSRSKQVAKMDKTDQLSLEERFDRLTTNVEAQQKLLDRFIALYEAEKLLYLLQRGDEDRQKKDAITSKDAELEKMRREISNMNLMMERQTTIYVQDKVTWEQEREQLQKELKRYKALSQSGSTDDYPCPKPTVNKLKHIFSTPTENTRKSQVCTKDLSKSHKSTDCNEIAIDHRSYLEFNLSDDCKASPRYDWTICYKQFLQKDNYERHMATHANKDTVSHQIKGMEAAFACNKRRQAIQEDYELEYSMCAGPKEKKQPKQVGLKPIPDAFTSYDFETLDTKLKGTLRNMEQMRQLEPSSVPAAAVGQKQADSPKLEQNATVEAGIEITKKTLYNLQQNSKGPASVGLLAFPKLTVDHQTKQYQVLSPSEKAEIKAAFQALPIPAPNSKLVPVPNFAGKEQTVEQQVKRKEVFSKSEETDIDEAARALCCLMELPKSISVSVKQGMKQDVVLAPNDEAKIREDGKRPASTNKDAESSSASIPAAPELSIVVPTSDPTDNNLRPNLRQRFIALLLRHPCADSACLILTFRGYVEHASQCVDGPNCRKYICERVQAKSAHLRTCRDKLDCTFCQPYICFNGNKLQGMMKVLEKGCPLNQDSVNGMSESTREAIMTMIARLAVDYGLIGDDEKLHDDEDASTTDSEDIIVEIDVEALSLPSKSSFPSFSESSSSESSSSSDGDDSSDEEDSSEGKTSEDWEMIEAERRQEVD